MNGRHVYPNVYIGGVFRCCLDLDLGELDPNPPHGTVVACPHAGLGDDHGLIFDSTKDAPGYVARWIEIPVLNSVPE